MLLFTPGGVATLEAPNDALFIVSPSPTRFPIVDLPVFARARLRKTVNTKVAEVLSTESVVIDGLEGCEIHAVGKDTKTNVPVYLYQVVLLDGEKYYLMQGLVRHAHALGVSIVAGTDFSTPRDAPFPALHHELEELVAHGGLSPMDAIAAATRVAAQALGIEATHGTLEPGMSVNFVLLDSDPSADIANLRTVRAVWKNAARFDRSVFRAR